MKRGKKYVNRIAFLLALVLSCTETAWGIQAAAEGGDYQSYEFSIQDRALHSELRAVASGWSPVDGRSDEEANGLIEAWMNTAGEKLLEIVEERQVMALVYLSDEYPLREKPDNDSQVLLTLLSGQMVNITDVYLDENFTVWYQVELNYKGVTMYGYIPGEYLAVSDSRFLEWEETYRLEEAVVTVEAQRLSEAAPDSTTEPGAADAPAGTTEPGATDAPAGTTEPDATDSPAGTTEPGATDVPGSTTAPDATDAPANTAEPATTATPVPTATPEPTPTAAPVYRDIEMFPESYKPALLALKEKYPNWVFVKMNTTLDWQTVIDNQMLKGRSLVWRSLPDWTKELRYDSIEDEWYYALYDDTGNWYYASEAGLKMYMDPRNGLTEAQIFQFEQLTYNETYHTLDAIRAFLNNTFMNESKLAPETAMTYAEIFWYIGKEDRRRVSPFHLAARVLQEQGNGNSKLISGKEPGYEGYYNYFNIGASGTTEADVIRNGLQYAKDNNWQGAYFSIMGGADFISRNYIQQGQDSLYLQKFNVNPNATYPLYTHQYMQNITAPSSEAVSMRRLYASAGALDNTFVFSIPVYENMPEEPCGEPKPEPTPEPTPTPVPVEPSEEVYAFVDRMYTVALDREAEEDGRYFWAAKLTTGESDGAGLAFGFLLSEEFKNKNHSNREYVKVLYETFFDRTPAEGEDAFWVEALNNGHPKEGILSGFVNSAEFAALCGAYEIESGVMREDGTVLNPGAAAFTKRLYTKVFGRDGDLGGIVYWAENIQNGVVTAEGVSKEFFQSTEYQNKNTTDEEYVCTLYATFLDREADADGLENWLNHLNDGKTREFVLEGFARSEEFKELMGKYGL